MLKNKKKIIIYTGLALSLIASSSITNTTRADAKENKVIMDNPFTEQQVKINHQEEQNDKNLTHLKFDWVKNKTYQASISIINKTDKEKDYHVQINKETSDSKGDITYKDNQQNSFGTKPLITELVTSVRDFKVKPNEEYKLNINVKMPEKEITGVKKGAIIIDTKDQNKKNRDYTIPVEINGVKNNNVTELGLSDLSLNKKITELTISGVNTLSNEYKDAEMNVSLTSKNKKHVYGFSKKINIAPESEFNFKVNTGKEFEEVKTGDYTLKVEVKTKENTWSREKSVKIVKKRNNQKLIYIPVVGLIVATFIFIIRKTNKKA